jgi:hypothetical protein
MTDTGNKPINRTEDLLAVRGRCGGEERLYGPCDADTGKRKDFEDLE